MSRTPTPSEHFYPTMFEYLQFGALWDNHDWFTALCEFYREKHRRGYLGLFSCSAVEKFPLGWIEACNKGVWDEEGEYGDNFRKTFNLSKQ